jgi:hypothetical protein
MDTRIRPACQAGNPDSACRGMVGIWWQASSPSPFFSSRPEVSLPFWSSRPEVSLPFLSSRPEVSLLFLSSRPEVSLLFLSSRPEVSLLFLSSRPEVRAADRSGEIRLRLARSCTRGSIRRLKWLKPPDATSPAVAATRPKTGTTSKPRAQFPVEERGWVGYPVPRCGGRPGAAFRRAGGPITGRQFRYSGVTRVPGMCSSEVLS